MASPDPVQAQLESLARQLYPDTIAVGQLCWPDVASPSADNKAPPQERAGGLPGRIALVVTPTRLFATSYRSGRSGLKLKDEHGVWDRADVRVVVSYPHGNRVARVELTTRDETIELDAVDAEGVNREFLAAISG